MSRNIQISLPSEFTDKITSRVKSLDGLIGLRIHKNISIEPKGDVLDFDLINSEVANCLKIFESEGLLDRKDVSVTTSRPTNVLSRSASEKILTETHETSWEDILKNLLHQSDMSLNTLIVMFSAGIIASIGISTNTLHTVIGAMLVAPGFEPISRAVMGIVAKHRDWVRGSVDVLKGYIVLVAGGIAGAFIASLFQNDVLPGTSTYLSSGSLVNYWMSFSPTSIMVSIVASLVGGIIIMSNKSLLTAGVMVALALIPSGTLVGMWLFEGNFELAGKALVRLLLEIAIVAVFTAVIFLWKRFSTHKRDMRV